MAQSSCFMWIIHGFRYLLLLGGITTLIASTQIEGEPATEIMVAALIPIAIGFPYSLILRLFGFGKRDPAPADSYEQGERVILDEWYSVPATSKQLSFIRHLGGKPPKGLTKGAASEMIDALLAENRNRH